MKFDPSVRFYEAMNWAGLAIVATVAVVALAIMASGCASMWASIKSAAAPAVGGAGGAAAGSLAGPAGTIVGAGVGAMVGDSLEESASLRSGETIGEGALLKHFQTKAMVAEQHVRDLSSAASLAQEGSAWLKKLMQYGALGLVGWFLWRSRHNFRELGFRQGLVHAILGGGFGKGCR